MRQGDIAPSYEVIKFPNKILKETCEIIPIIETLKYEHQKYQLIANRMLRTMYNYEGVGLAAPQIGETIRMIVLNHKMQGAATELVMINPVITEFSKGAAKVEEGCLSMPNVFEMIRRHKEITVEYLDFNFEKRTAVAVGFEAQIIQHEVEHLDGTVLFDNLGAKRSMVLSKFLKGGYKKKKKFK